MMQHTILELKYEQRLMQKSFLRYLGPAVLALVFGQIAPLVDAVCISRSLGEEALSMMSVMSPIYYAYNVIAVLFGIGAGVFIAKEAGLGKNHASGRCFTRSFILMSVITVIFSAALLVFMEPVALFLRSTPENIAYVREYMTVFVAGGIFYVWNFAGGFILTDDGDPNLAMAGDTLYALATAWGEKDTRAFRAAATECTVVFDPNGGAWDGSKSPVVIHCTVGATITTQPAPTRRGFTFAGWYGNDGTNYPADADCVIHGDTVFTAKWIPKTGDDHRLLLWSLMILSGGAGWMILRKRRGSP